MKVKDPHFILEKIEKYISEDIRPSRIRAAVELDRWKYKETSMEEQDNAPCAAAYDDSGWQDFRLPDTWGGYDRVAWFRTSVRVPEEMAGHRLALKLLPGPRDGGDSTAEALLYVDGAPVQGIDVWHEEAVLQEELCRKKELQIALKAWSGVLGVPRQRTFKLAQLLWVDSRVERFCYVVDTVRRCALLLKENDLRRIRLTQLLNRTFSLINFLNFKEESYYRSVYEALDCLLSGLDELGETQEIKPVVYGVGHSHIDMAWLWRLSATREKASRTFSTVLNLMKQYPEYRYMHSSPQLYRFLQQDYPALYEQVKERVREGRWEITGGMWVEPDTNVPSGESLVRQFVYGKRFIREEFGMETTLAWLPDVFGYSAAFPQIMKKCGMKYFMTTKISWNQYNHFPYDTFWWKGIDGTEIFTHFITTPEDGSWFYTYNGHMDPEEVMGVWDNYKDKDKNDELLIAYGWGDGGGGPTREMLEQSRVMKNIPGIPGVKMSTAEGYFQRLYEHADKDKLGTWDGELYFELHRGTYTSQAETKANNRKTEILLHNAELLSQLAHLDGAPYPKEELDEMWERTLLNQFHDILPGSSIRQVYEDTARDYEAIRRTGNALIAGAVEKLVQKIRVSRNSVVLYNTAGYERSGYVHIPYGTEVGADTVFADESGLLPQKADREGILVYVSNLPSFGYKTLQLTESNASRAVNGEGVTVSGDTLVSPFYRMTFNANGEIESLYDREHERAVGCGQPMNVFAAFEDKPQRFDAWDIDIYYKEKPYAPFVLTAREVRSQGETAVIRSTWQFNKSVLTQDMIVYARDRRIDFVTTVDWKEEQVFLKAYFPVDIHAGEASYEIQYGSIRRPTHTNTEWDFARFEVPGHRWADLAEGNYGVAILNDCKYGYDIHGNVLGLSLIKSAVRPDETADRRVHHFTYSLYPHDMSADVTKAAVSLNMPVLTQEVQAAAAAAEFARSSFVRTDCGHVLLDTVKRSEDGLACVVRLYEYQNCRDSHVELFFDRNVKRVTETNLCEEEEVELASCGNSVTFDIGCFEIKTFKIYF